MQLLKILLFSGGVVLCENLHTQSLKPDTPVTYMEINGEEYVKRDLSSVLNLFSGKINKNAHEYNAEIQWNKYYSRPHPSVKTLKKYFYESAEEFGVPQKLLEVIGQVENNWTQVGPSIDRGWGIMHLVDNEYSNTLLKASELLNLQPEILKEDARQNIRGAAALIAYYAGDEREKFKRYEDWFYAVKRFTGLINDELSEKQAVTYYSVLSKGVASQTLWDETIEIKPVPGIDVLNLLNKEYLQNKNMYTTDYAPALAGFIPCNYTTGRSHVIDTWVHHWIGVGTYAGAISWFNNCSAQASAHFVIRSSDGEITQCVYVANTAWHSGASGYSNNIRSIGVEHEATSSNPGLWNDPDMLQASANMTCYFANKFSIPVSLHTSPGICGHNEMPGTNTACPGTLPWSTWELYFNNCMNASQNPGNLIANVSSCPSDFVYFNWNNSGTGWYIAVSTDPDYGQFYWKWVSGLTSYTGPAGFVDHVDGVSPLVFQNGITYYWKVWNGNNYTNGNSFVIPICDSINPCVSINQLPAWQTGNFNVSFNDFDNVDGSGISDCFYLVSDFDGQAWSANFNEGFFYQDFGNGLPACWTINYNGGNWNVINSYIEQNDGSVANSNISAPLLQTDVNNYLYQWKGFISSQGTGESAGLHFFASSSTQAERGDSYFVNFDALNDRVFVYKSLNNVLILKQIAPFIINTDIWYDFKIMYKPAKGQIKVYINDKLACSWTDAMPLLNGSYLSLRNSNCETKYDNIMVYKNRVSIEQIKVNNSQGNFIRFQNFNPSSFAGKIYTINCDSMNNWSLLVDYPVKVDLTPPLTVNVNDGMSYDIDTLDTGMPLSSFWNSSFDSNSGIKAYYVCVGTQAGDCNLISMTGNGYDTVFNFTYLTIQPGMNIFTTVKVYNNAGLFSESSSDGVLIYDYASDIDFSLYTIEKSNIGVAISPNPAKDEFAYISLKNKSDKIEEIKIFDISGKDVADKSTCIFGADNKYVVLDIKNSCLKSGIYVVKCVTKTGISLCKFIVP